MIARILLAVFLAGLLAACQPATKKQFSLFQHPLPSPFHRLPLPPI